MNMCSSIIVVLLLKLSLTNWTFQVHTWHCVCIPCARGRFDLTISVVFIFTLVLGVTHCWAPVNPQEKRHTDKVAGNPLLLLDPPLGHTDRVKEHTTSSRFRTSQLLSQPSPLVPVQMLTQHSLHGIWKGSAQLPVLNCSQTQQESWNFRRTKRSV